MKTNRMRQLVIGLIVLAFAVGLDPSVWRVVEGADQEAAGTSGLRVRQERLSQSVAELEARIMALADTLEAEDEPGQAQRLREARARSQQEGLTALMDESAELIEAGDLRAAERKQDQVIEKLHEIIMLLEEDDALDQYVDEAEMLEQFRKELDDLIQRATDTALDTERLTRKDEVLEALEQRVRELQELEQAQREINEQFEENQGRGLRALGRVADEQHTLRRDTERLMEAIRREMTETGLHRPDADPDDAEAAPAPGEGEPGEGEPGEGEPGEAAPGEGEPGEAGAPGEGEPGEAGMPGEDEPGQPAMPGEGEPGEAGAPGEGEPGEGEPGAAAEGEPADAAGQAPDQQARGESEGSPIPGQESMGRAIERQQEAERQAGQGRGRNAEAEGEAAAEELKKAIEELEAEMDRIAQLPEDEIAAAQEGIAEDTDDLGKRLAEAEADGIGGWDAPGGDPGDGEPGDGQPGDGEPGDGEPGDGQPGDGEPGDGQPGDGEPGDGEPGDGQPGDGQPGDGQPGDPGADPGADDGPQTPSQQIQRAREQMEEAARRLREAQADQARPEQDDAIRELQEARERLEERLAQLREEMQDELLAALEARFRAMLDRQLNINRGTNRLTEVDREDWGRPQQLLRSELVREERAVGEAGRRALTIITEDGTTVIFPAIVRGLIEDIDMVADRLDEGLVDDLTTSGQEDIVATLRELIEALEQAQEMADAEDDMGEGEGEMGEPERQPLVPDSAELKLLRAAQLRVNERTVMFDRHKAEAEGAEPGQEAYARNLAGMQQKVADMTYDLIYRR